MIVVAFRFSPSVEVYHGYMIQAQYFIQVVLTDVGPTNSPTR